MARRQGSQGNAFREVRYRIFHEDELKAIKYPNPDRPWVIIDTKYDHDRRRGKIIARAKHKRHARRYAYGLNFWHNKGSIKLQWTGRFMVFGSHEGDTAIGIDQMRADFHALTLACAYARQYAIDNAPRAQAQVYDQFARRIVYTIKVEPDPANPDKPLFTWSETPRDIFPPAKDDTHARGQEQEGWNFAIAEEGLPDDPVPSPIEDLDEETFERRIRKPMSVPLD